MVVVVVVVVVVEVVAGVVLLETGTSLGWLFSVDRKVGEAKKLGGFTTLSTPNKQKCKSKRLTEA